MSSTLSQISAIISSSEDTKTAASPPDSTYDLTKPVISCFDSTSTPIVGSSSKKVP